jgi:hypothetical protein
MAHVGQPSRACLHQVQNNLIDKSSVLPVSSVDLMQPAIALSGLNDNASELKRLHIQYKESSFKLEKIER